jgi:myo-inositol-1(or 4)-monophosphatase
MDMKRIEALLREIGRYQVEGYQKLQHADVKIKTDSSYGLSVVTEYDVESERRVFEFLSKEFPGDSFLGEENGNVRKDPQRYWVLDPIDGTSNFTQGVVYWGPTLAFCDKDGPAMGWIYLPAIDQMFHARRGEGAYLNGKRIHSSTATEYSDLTTVATTSRFHRSLRLTAPAKHRILGSLVANLAYLATGTFAASFARANVWDIAAGILIAREAGAIVDCRPEFSSIDLSSIDTKNRVSLTLYGRANKALPSLEEFFAPV